MTPEKVEKYSIGGAIAIFVLWLLGSALVPRALVAEWVNAMPLVLNAGVFLIGVSIGAVIVDKRPE
jgi:hypothetical protein